jgi:hypothetical protein
MTEGEYKMIIPRELIIDLLVNYSRNKAILEQLRIENDVSINASVVNDIPRSITNKFFSVTESLALWKQEETELERSVNLVDTWLSSLSYMQCYMLTKKYILGYSYRMITEDWRKMYGDIYSERYWRNKRNEAVNYISKLYEKGPG